MGKIFGSEIMKNCLDSLKRAPQPGHNVCFESVVRRAHGKTEGAALCILGQGYEQVPREGLRGCVMTSGVAEEGVAAVKDLNGDSLTTVRWF